MKLFKKMKQMFFKKTAVESAAVDAVEKSVQLVTPNSKAKRRKQKRGY